MHAVLFLLAMSATQVVAFINGFPKEQCDEMDPTKIKLESKGPAAEENMNATEFAEEDQPPTSVRLSDSLNLYRIVTSAPKYRRGRVMDITIRGPEFNAFMLQVRKIGADERRGYDQIVRVGEFVNLPANLQSVMCDKNQATAVTNKNYSPKSGITIKWKAPKEEVGDLHIVARFVAGDEYWPMTESREIPMNEFPVNLKYCGKDKSCVLWKEKSASCHEDDCDYILAYSVVDNSNVEFVLGGSSEQTSYLAIGFSSTPEAETMNIIACTRAKTVAEIKYYTFTNIEDGPIEQNMNLENKKMDLDGDRMWCSFVVPMVTQVEDGPTLDLSVPLYQVYLRGSTNYTKSSNTPILPSKLQISKTEVALDKIKILYHTMEKPKERSGANALQSTLLAVIVVLTANHVWEKSKIIL